MAIKDILVYLDTSPRNPVRLALATHLAAQHQAHLTGLHVIDVPSASYFYGAAMPFLPAAPDEIVTRLREDALAAAVPLEQAFHEKLQQDGIEGEWRLAEGDAAATLALYARYADFTVIGQPDLHEERDGIASAIPVTAVLTSGRPVLAIPFAGSFPSVARRVLVAWNGSRESVRAANDALPLLQAADHVTILTISRSSGDEAVNSSAAGITRHLARHGVQAEVAQTVAKAISDGDALLSYAADSGADLIVAGAYGHSRARELVFGGVTRTLLTAMTVPVLLSH